MSETVFIFIFLSFFLVRFSLLSGCLYLKFDMKGFILVSGDKLDLTKEKGTTEKFTNWNGITVKYDKLVKQIKYYIESFVLLQNKLLEVMSFRDLASVLVVVLLL